MSVFRYDLLDPRAGHHQYRVANLDPRGGTASSMEVAAEDDADVVRLTRALGVFRAIEVWDGPRFLARFGPGEAVVWGDTDAAPRAPRADPPMPARRSLPARAVSARPV